MLHSRLRPLPRHRLPQSNQDPVVDSPETPDLDDGDDPEGLFNCFIPHLFPDDAPSFHGDPGQTLLYSCFLPQKRELEIMLPVYPGEDDGGEKGEGNVDTEDGRRLFAYFLWSAALIVAQGMEETAAMEAEAEETKYVLHKDEMRWSVKGENVLELGAGTALPSIVSLFANAASVAITDHPSSSALGPTGAIRKNLEKNVPETLLSRACVHAHEWGDLDSSFAKDSKGLFSRIIVADCLWIKGQHENLVKTILWFLSEGGDSNGDSKGGSNGTVWVVAGFHTGRKIVASFFDTAVNMGLEIEEIWEKDVNAKDEEDGDTLRAEREWRPFRDGEDPYQSRRWCVVAFLRRKKDPYRAGSWKQCFRNFIHCSR